MIIISQSEEITMESNAALESLRQLYCNNDWFSGVGTDNYGRYVVYTRYMSLNILRQVVDKLEDKPVLVHFSSAQEVNKDQYVNNLTPVLLSEDVLDEEHLLDENDLEEVAELEVGLVELVEELDRLEKLCNSNTVQDIFYEVHDGINAVTNLSARYPEVRAAMEVLYKKYGFDIIYEELDG
jgi:hypothetical protein